MKTLLSSIIIILLGIQISFAQRGGEIDPSVFAQRQTDQMQIELDLKNNQLASVAEINLKYVVEMHNLRASGLQAQVMRAQFQKIQSSRMKELKTVLTKEQYKKYVKLQNKNKPNPQNKGKGNGQGRGQGQGQGHGGGSNYNRY